MTTEFYGDNIRWFIAKVISNTPPKGFEGRVRIRIYGIHSEKESEVSEKMLPWALTSMPVTSLVTPAPGLPPNTTVFGIFTDGKTSQQPLILGALPTFQNPSKIQIKNKIKKLDEENGAISNTTIGNGSYKDVSGTKLDGDPNTSPFIELLDNGPGWCVIKRKDGTVEKRTGHRNWRNNNPGNIEWRGGFAKRNGGIDTDGRFALFTTYTVGREAKRKLLFTGVNYVNLTLSNAIARYAPKFENDTAGYARAVLKVVNNVDQVVSLYTKAEQDKILDAMQRVEGYVVGRVEVLQEKVLVEDDLKKYPIIYTKLDLSTHINYVPRTMSKMVVHWTQTYSNKYLTATDLNYIDKKSGLDGIQYHLVIRRDGSLQVGRDINKYGLDGKDTLSVAFVGGLNCPSGTKSPEKYLDVKSLTPKQFNTFNSVVKTYLINEPTGTIVGYSDTDPGFDVADYVKKFKKGL